MTENALRYQGDTGRLATIWFTNLILSIITLMIYRPWARTRLRKYVYSQFHIQGEPLHYSGTGGELFRGACKAYILLFAFFFVLGMVSAADPSLDPDLPADEQAFTALSVITTLITYAAVFYLFHFGIYSGRRYRLSRTKWRGIRGALTGAARHYAWRGLGYSALNFVTLGLIIPRNDMRLRKLLVEDLQFGEHRCQFNADHTPLLRVHYITWLLAIPTLGFSRIWYRAQLRNLFLKNMTLGSVRFDGTQTGGTLAWLVVGNLLLYMTIIGIPFALQRYIRYIAQHTHILGDIDALQLTQSPDLATASGDAIEQGFGDDIDFDMGVF